MQYDPEIHWSMVANPYIERTLYDYIRKNAQHLFDVTPAEILAHCNVCSYLPDDESYVHLLDYVYQIKYRYCKTRPVPVPAVSADEIANLFLLIKKTTEDEYHYLDKRLQKTIQDYIRRNDVRRMTEQEILLYSGVNAYLNTKEKKRDAIRFVKNKIN